MSGYTGEPCTYNIYFTYNGIPCKETYTFNGFGLGGIERHDMTYVLFHEHCERLGLPEGHYLPCDARQQVRIWDGDQIVIQATERVSP